jgi:hypothetical protein
MDDPREQRAPLDVVARMRVEALRAAVIGEAIKQARSRDVPAEAREILLARATMLDHRVTEMLDHIEQVEPAYQG